MQILSRRISDEFHRIKLEPQIVCDARTIYNLEEIWQLNMDGGIFNVVLEKETEREYRLFVQYTKLPSIHYRQMNYSPTECFSKEMAYLEFFRKHSIKEFPREINDLILGFLLPVKIAFQFHLKNDEHYPFNPSSWIIERYFYCNAAKHNNALDSDNYEKYHTHLVRENEQIMKENWSPAITIDKQILLFITNLNFAKIADVTCP